MPQLVPVDFDPFAGAPPGGGAMPTEATAKLVPVDHDPFADDELYRQQLAKAKEAFKGPQVPPPAGITLPSTPEQAAREGVAHQRAEEAQQAAFDASRTPGNRFADTLAFVESLPVRAATRGEYGIGDIAEKIGERPEFAQTLRQREGQFAQANQGWLEKVAQAGELGVAIPGLQSMGAAPGGILAANRLAMGNRMLRGAPANVVAPVATEAQAYGPAMRIADRDAFLAEGIPEFAPAFGSKGLARTARTIEEAPLVGGTVKVPKTAVEQGMGARQAQIAQDAGAAASPEDVGLIAQRGLSRFRTSDLEDLERSQVQDLGLTPDRPPQRVQGNVNLSRPSQLNTAAMTDQELNAAAQSRVDLPGSNSFQDRRSFARRSAAHYRFAGARHQFRDQGVSALPACRRCRAARDAGQRNRQSRPHGDAQCRTCRARADAAGTLGEHQRGRATRPVRRSGAAARQSAIELHPR